MNKKNKRKQARKILPVILALVMMLSIMTFGVSAFTEGCEHRINDYDDSSLRSGTMWAHCRNCGDVLITVEGDVKDLLERGYHVAMFVSPLESGEDYWSILWFDEEELGEADTPCIIGAPVVEEAEEKGMIGSMVETITDSLGGILTGVGASIVSFFDATVLATNEAGETQLTTFAVWALAFLGVGFGLGVVKFITNIVRKR